MSFRLTYDRSAGVTCPIVCDRSLDALELGPQS